MKFTDQVNETKEFFFQAIKAGNFFLFKSLLETLLKLFKIEEMIDSKYNATALHWAADNGHLEIVQFLVEKFPQLIDSITPDSSTPILFAVMNGHTEVVEFLTEKNASLNIKADFGKTPLSAAAAKSDDHPIKIFLNKYQNTLEINTLSELIPQEEIQIESPQLKINYYDELVKSIPSEDKDQVITELESFRIIQRAEKLCEELESNKWVGLDASESRTLFLAALRNLKYEKMSAAQLASLHLFDAAIRTLYINPMVYFIHNFVNADSEEAKTYNLFALASLKGMPTSVQRFKFNTTPLPKEEISLSDLPQRMQKPLMQRFFNFSDSEWEFFCKEMQKASPTEQFFQVLIAPSEGCWSSIVTSIQRLSKCMHTLDWWSPLKKGGFATEDIMLVPSFTMLQTTINAKANTLGRKPIQLIPTYGYIDEKSYNLFKKSGVMPVTLYLPEHAIHKRYNPTEGQFRTKIDGHPIETSFGGAIHDVYHALREMMMSESIANARWRLVDIAKNHPKNQSNPNGRRVDEILADGELIYCYPLDQDTIFNAEYRPNYAQKFGDLFNLSSIKYSLHGDLKRAFIGDMVENQEIWSKSFNIGRKDLYESERQIYDELMMQKTSSSKKQLTTKPSYSSAQTISEIGLLANNIDKKDNLTNDRSLITNSF